MMFTARKDGGAGDLRALVDGTDDPARRYPPPALSDVVVERKDSRLSVLWRAEPEGRVPGGEEPSWVDDAVVGSGRTKGSGW